MAAVPYAVYILTNAERTALHVGVTGDPSIRLARQRACPGGLFTPPCPRHRLVYVEWYVSLRDALARERSLRSGGRRRVVCLIEEVNPRWEDLGVELDAH
jgi:putative endonuclease